VVVVFFTWVIPHEIWTVLPGWLQRVTPDILGHTDGVVFVDSHDGFVIAGLLTIAGAAAYLWVTRHRERQNARVTSPTYGASISR
jgi:hypothetical protein